MFCSSASAFRQILLVLIALGLNENVEGAIECQGSSPPPPDSEPLFSLGDPALFVSTSSQNYDAYSLVDSHRRTSILEEYLMAGYHKDENRSKTGLVERVQMVLYDGVKRIDAKASEKPDLVYQNLEKELYWRYFNSTGIYPSMTIVNATTRISLQFHTYNTQPDNPNDVAYSTWISVRNFFLEPQVPYTAVFEIPANSRVLRKFKTLVEYQSFSLWRWRLSQTVMKWTEIIQASDDYLNNTLVSNFHRVENPCIKDMFIVFVPRSSKTPATPGKDEKLVYLASPLIQSHLEESWFYDMKTKEHPWYPEAPDTIVLTNDHLVVLTITSLWISNSLNDSSNPNVDLEMAGNYTSRPDLTYSMADPCENFRDTIDCFLQANDTRPNETYTIHKLFYIPVCYLYQFPNYDDYMIFTIERTSTISSGEKVIDFSVLYAAKPYTDWRILFTNVAYYKIFRKPEMGADVKAVHISHAVIVRIVGVFFNHHKRHFDITLQLQSAPKYVRFVLPEPTTTFDGFGELLSKSQIMNKAHASPEVQRIRQLNATVGSGFSEFEFPQNFEMEDVVVNPNTLDVFFLGNQFWIAEAGGPSVYPALSGLSAVENSMCPDTKFNDSRIRECSFNHPDKIYVCMSMDRRLVLTGKTGSRYTPSVIKVDYIQELIMAQKVNPWEAKYFCELVQTKSVFLSGYSGKMLFWFWHEPDEEANAIQAELSSGCSKVEDQPVLCDSINDWKSAGCKSVPSGKPGFRMVAINPAKLTARKQNTDGPLAPFLVDSNTALLYEGTVPPQEGKTYDYFNEVFVGQKIFCTNYDLQKTEANDIFLQHNCELFIRHIKPVENYLDGLRRCLYANIVKSIPLLPLPADVVVLVHARSNWAYIKVNDYLNSPPWIFEEKHIGQTLYIPGNFSVLLTAFPVENDATVMEGYTTKYFQHERRYIFRAYYIFLMDMSTQIFRDAQLSLAAQRVNETKERWAAIDKENLRRWNALNETRHEIEKRWSDSDFSEKDPSGTATPVFRAPISSFLPGSREVEELDLLTIKKNEEMTIGGQPHPWTPVTPPNAGDLVHGQVGYNDRLIWYVSEGECHYVMSLVNNPVLKTSGGRISLDLYDRISFEVLLRPLTPLGKILMYRPLMVVTNSNPNILRVEVVEKLKGNPQFFQFLLSPTGFKKGVAVITVRTRVSSLLCPSSTSVTLIVLCHRDVGRRLHANYPIPSCKPDEEEGMYPRPWFNEMEGCISNEELLDPHKKEIYRYRNGRKVLAYVSLPPNYRPPSFDGTDIPQTRNVYNADPSKPAYKAWYQISKETIELNRCAGKSTKSECRCNPVDRLMDDEEMTECKEKAFAVKRTGTGEPITISFTYDRIIRDSDQNPELFLPKKNWSITVEEVNGRGEWYIASEHTPYIRMINADPELHRGRRYYDMNEFKVTLLGTGLFHFKVKLGSFESFDQVTGYFILYASTDDINHVHLFMILLGTIIFCMTMVLLGFLANRKRLSSMLPIQPMSHKRKLKLL